MAAGKKGWKPSTIKPRTEYAVFGSNDESETLRAAAEMALAPSTAATRVVNAVDGKTSFGDILDIGSAIDALKAPG